MTKAGPKPEPTPFERLRDFARKIVAVPKAEINEKEAEYRLEREKIKKVGARAVRKAL